MDSDAFGFIGFGLIGGSIACAIRQKYPDAKIIAYDHHKDTYNQNLIHAKEDGIINSITYELSDLSGCNIIFSMCTCRSQYQLFDSAETILIFRYHSYRCRKCKGRYPCCNRCPRHESKILSAGHPMTGSEKTGYDHSNPMLMENAYYILTPTKDVSQDKVMTLYKIVRDMKSYPYPS